MGVCVWEADVKICHALHLRTMEAAAARLTCHVPYTAVSNSHPKTHQSPLPLTEHSVLRSEAWMTILNLLMFFLSLLLIWKCTRRENDVCQTQNHHCLNEHHGLTCQNSFFGLMWFIYYYYRQTSRQRYTCNFISRFLLKMSTVWTLELMCIQYEIVSWEKKKANLYKNMYN